MMTSPPRVSRHRLARALGRLLAVLSRSAGSRPPPAAPRQEAEEALRDSEERFRTAFKDAPIGMTLVNLKGQFLDVNDSLCRIVGYPQEELLAKTFQDITHPEDLEPDLENVRRLLEGKISSYQMEKRYFHKDGHIVPVLLTASLVRDSRGEPLYFISQIQDISEQKQLDQAWRFLAETGPRLADSLDPQTTVATVARLIVPALADWCIVALLDDERRLQSLEGVAKDPEKQTILHELLADYPPDPSSPGTLMAEVLRTNQPMLLPEVSDATLAAAAADARHLQLLRRLQLRSGVVLPLTARGHVVGTLSIGTCEPGRHYEGRDFALLEELAGRAALAFDNAWLYKKSEQAKRIRDEVLRIVAHDLRTPLQVVTMSAGILMKRLPEEDSANRRHFDAILRAVDRATQLIQDLLDVTRMEAGRLLVERKPEPIGPVIEEVVALHLGLAEAKSIQLAILVPENCPRVFADRDRTCQILSNLLGNALKFTPAGGRITLRVEPVEDMLRFSVSDTGPGIPAEDQPHLFEAFWQGRGGLKKGAGLGLAIARGFVEAHGGRIWVQSSPERGSCFFFTLPTMKEALSGAASPNRSACHTSSGPVRPTPGGEDHGGLSPGG
ncbi:sensor histidine kinase [Hyalangium versicolor]|uniref:sensor histidine kinase n=1 Tax=Hyalangium versicolor TaxID=2861190 RepID=UPI001CCEC5EC|nr:GAF domain-containing sensor histidine kinase [Hyalangium versicolor]